MKINHFTSVHGNIFNLFIYFLNTVISLLENEVRCSDVLFQRQTDAHSLTNPPSDCPSASASAMNE